ncbi:hypothetical protein BGZ76_011178, partial [Entomortierella beljakovae]
HTVNHAGYINMVKQHRIQLLNYKKPIITILEAVKRPSMLEVDEIPNFYELAQNIETDRIIEISDCDDSRFEMGECEAMGKFLRRCINLRTLTIAADRPDAFSWAIQDGRATSGMALMKLENLKVTGGKVIHEVIKSFNDAMIAFASSLRCVTLLSRCYKELRDYPYETRNIWILRSLQLQRVASANSIGNFPKILPNLTRLEIYSDSSVNIGTFDNCPNLEWLSIELTRSSQHRHRPQQEEEPTTLPGPEILLDPNWQHPDIDYNLFPAWNLPNLKQLNLEGMAAVRFDFESLPTMRKLNWLSIRWEKSPQPISTEDYRIRQLKIPLVPSLSTSTSNQRFGIFGSYSFQQWSLPDLTFIHIDGLPSTVFCLEYLRLFPRLESLSLSYPGGRIELPRYPICAQINGGSIQFSTYNYESSTILLSSKLKEFHLFGFFIMGYADLISLMTIYAPFLQDFSADKLMLHGVNGWCRLLKSIHQADDADDMSRDLESVGVGSKYQAISTTSTFQESDHLNSSNIGKLPLECIYYIIDNLKDETGTLHALLFVNKFFFNVAIRHLYTNDFLQVNDCHRPNPLELDTEFLGIPNQLKRLSVVVASFLQARVKESLDTPGNNETPHQIVDRVLERFGLELNNVTYQPSGIAFLQEIYRSIGYPYVECEASLFSTMTIDYSKLVTNLAQYDFQRIGIFRLRNSAQQTKQTTSSKNNLETVHDEFQKSLDDWYDRFMGTLGTMTMAMPVHNADLIYAITDMVMYYNHEYIATFDCDVDQMYRFLPYATKFTNLQAICLCRHGNLLDAHLNNTITFINQNQSTFTRKAAIEVLFGYRWNFLYNEDVWDFSYVGDQIGYIRRLTSIRDGFLHHTKPKLAILEAVKRPSSIRIDDIPKFYELAQNIQTDRLVQLFDADPSRFEMGESEAMGAFLQRCSNLKTLELAVDSLDAFSWTNRGSGFTSGSDLMKLEKLSVLGGNVCYEAVKAFNDAMVIFASSLRSVSVKSKSHNNGYDLPNETRNIWVLRSLQLQQQILANSIGNFQEILPNLTRLEIDSDSSINIGSFNSCPSLEWLSISLWRLTDLRRRPIGNEPTTLPGPNSLLDPCWQYREIDYSLFPVWNLPKLKYLKLYETAALRFDFASLPTMQSLEEFHTRWDLFVNDEPIISEYRNRQLKIPSKAASTPSIGISNQRYGIFGSHSFQQWSLPNLTTISMEGPSSSLFCLEYIRLFPKLRSLSLRGLVGHTMELRRYPLRAQMNKGSIQFRSNNYKMNVIPFISQLEEFELYEDWSMSSADLTRLLTIYAPFLQELSAWNLTCHGDDDVLEAIHRADNENSMNGIMKSQGADPPRQQLRKIMIALRLDEEAIQELGLKQIERKDGELFEKQGVRIYSLLGRSVVRNFDYKRIKG